MLELSAACRKLKTFLIDGALQPGLSQARLGQSIAIVGEFFAHLKKVENFDEDGAGDEMQTVARLQRCGSHLADELITPLRGSFQLCVFSHKHLKDFCFEIRQPEGSSFAICSLFKLQSRPSHSNN